VPSLRACGARPSEGGASQGRMASRGKPGDNAKGDFLGGTRSPRPGGKAGGEPGYGAIMDELARGRWPNGGTFRLALCRHRGRAEPAPPRGVSQGQTALRGKPGDNAKGDFLGGTRSARPRCKAGRRPRHNMMIGAKRTPGGLEGICPGQARAFPSGVRSPPLRGGSARVRRPCGENPGTTRRAIFSEGRGLRVRVEKRGAGRGMS
jgi:hypothetical protein